MSGVPHPPDETADDLRAVLRRNHPELTDAEIDALFAAPPAPRRRGNHPDHHWYGGDTTRRQAGGRSVSRSGPVHRRGNRRR